MSVASGYVHISVRNAAKGGQPSGLRPGFGPRTALAPAELPVGVITGIFGAPFFLALLVRSRRVIV